MTNYGIAVTGLLWHLRCGVLVFVIERGLSIYCSTSGPAFGGWVVSIGSVDCGINDPTDIQRGDEFDFTPVIISFIGEQTIVGAVEDNENISFGGSFRGYLCNGAFCGAGVGHYRVVDELRGFDN